MIFETKYFEWANLLNVWKIQDLWLPKKWKLGKLWLFQCYWLLLCCFYGHESLFSTFCDNFQVNLAILCSLFHSETTIYVPTGKGRGVKGREGKKGRKAISGAPCQLLKMKFNGEAGSSCSHCSPYVILLFCLCKEISVKWWTNGEEVF